VSVNENDTKTWEPKILAFCCNWCSYAGADLAGLNRSIQPPNIRIIRVPCSGRVDPQFIIRAFQGGADGVLVAGCHPGDCHYSTGNFFARRRFLLFHRIFDYIGMDEGRLQNRWISGAEGDKFAATVKQVTEDIRALGPNRKLRDEHE
jgi:F420-non-reducing hydrogenase iron-sulfur subunit